jgi:hypothetical protein
VQGAGEIAFEELDGFVAFAHGVGDGLMLGGSGDGDSAFHDGEDGFFCSAQRSEFPS